MDLNNIDLLVLQTATMKDDPTTKAMCAAIGPVLQQVANSIANALILARVDDLPEEVLDELAHELHVDWYDAKADISVKRNLIKNSDKVHRYLGTPFAVEQVVQDYFGDGEVEEWFDYGGQPYYFRVVTENSAVTGELADQFNLSVNAVKNRRSRLEAVIVSMTGEMNLYFGNVLQTGDYITIEQVV